MLMLTWILLASAAAVLGDSDNSGWTHGASWSIPSSGSDGYGSDGKPAATVTFNMGVASGRSGYAQPAKQYSHVEPSYERTRSYSSGRPLKVVAQETYGRSSRYGSSYRSQPVYSRPAPVTYQPAVTYGTRATKTYSRPAVAYQPAVTYGTRVTKKYSRPAVSYQPAVTRTYSRPVYRQEAVSTYVQPATVYQRPVSTYSQPRVTYREPVVYRQPVVVRQEVPSYNQYSSYTVAARPHAPTVILNAPYGSSYGATRTYAESSGSDESYGTQRVVYGARPRNPTVVLDSGYGSQPSYGSSGSSYGGGAVVSSTVYGAPSQSYGGDDGWSRAPVVQASYEQGRY